MAASRIIDTFVTGTITMTVSEAEATILYNMQKWSPATLKKALVTHFGSDFEHAPDAHYASLFEGFKELGDPLMRLKAARTAFEGK